MIELDNPSCQELLLRLPADREKSFDYHGALFRPSATSEIKLGSFTFLTDDISGLRLKEFVKDGATWSNSEYDLWRLIVFDTAQTSSLGTSTVAGLAAKLSSITTTGDSIVATWTDISVGSVDSINVTLTLRLVEDWLNASVSIEWSGTATRFAIDSISVLPLRIAPRYQGVSDFAVVPAVFGILVEDPIRHLRYDTSVGGTTNLFRGRIRNVAWWPAGRGWSTGVFGYYETTEASAWMVWNERWDLTPFTACFQSDGQNMLFEAYVPQEDNVLVGNNSRTLEATDFCLRPLSIQNEHGWWDMAWHYKQRLAELQPDFYQPIRTARSDLSTYEKGPFVFIDLALSSYTGSTTYLDTLIGQLRTGLGITTTTPVFGIGDIPTCNLVTPYEAEIGDGRTTFATLFAKNIFVGRWQPKFDSNATGYNTGMGPQVWSKIIWNGTDKRWWSNLDGTGFLRESRQGYISGGGADRLAEYAAGSYYRERAYTVSSWDAGTKTATVSGTPSADGFPTSGIAATVLPQGGATAGDAVVSSLGASTIVMATLFTNGQAVTVTPVNGDIIQVFVQAISPCPHAQLNSASFIANLEANTLNGKFTVGKVCTTYIDEYDEPNQVIPTDYLFSCYRDHSSWSQIDGGYVRHPYGGGNWYMTAKNAYLQALRDSVRNLQQASSGLKAYFLNCEDVNETTNSIFDFCWHTIASGGLWRSIDNIDPSIDKYKAIPLFAVIHAGRVFGRAVNQELSSAALINAAPYTDAALHRTMAYWLASEWSYGLTLPTMSLYANDSYGSSALNFWDDTLYISGGGSVSNEVKQIRTLYERIQYAEINWIQEYLRYGEMMPPATIDWTGTDWTQGLSDTTYTSVYYSYDVIYDRTQYPRVVHAIWRSQGDGSILVILTNWTQAVASWSGTLPLHAFTYGRRAATFVASILDYTGSADTDTVFDYDTATGIAEVQSIPAYSVKAILLTPTLNAGGIQLIATYSGRKRNSQIDP